MNFYSSNCLTVNSRIDFFFFNFLSRTFMLAAYFPSTDSCPIMNALKLKPEFRTGKLNSSKRQLSYCLADSILSYSINTYRYFTIFLNGGEIQAALQNYLFAISILIGCCVILKYPKISRKKSLINIYIVYNHYLFGILKQSIVINLTFINFIFLLTCIIRLFLAFIFIGILNSIKIAYASSSSKTIVADMKY